MCRRPSTLCNIATLAGSTWRWRGVVVHASLVRVFCSVIGPRPQLGGTAPPRPNNAAELRLVAAKAQAGQVEVHGRGRRELERSKHRQAGHNKSPEKQDEHVAHDSDSTSRTRRLETGMHFGGLGPRLAALTGLKSGGEDRHVVWQPTLFFV